LRVGEIVAAVDVASRPSRSIFKVLAEVGFVLVEHRGTASWYRVNEDCISWLPERRRPRDGAPPAHTDAPWKAA